MMWIRPIIHTAPNRLEMSYQTQLQFVGIDAAHKLVAVDAHPHLPWMVGANDAGIVRVWDYVTRKAVHKFAITDLDTKERDANLLLALLEKDPGYKGPKVATGASQNKSSDQKKKIGNILLVKFVDKDVRIMKHELEKLSFIPDESPITDPKDAQAREAKRLQAFKAPHIGNQFPHLIFVIGEQRSFVFDYVSCALKELDHALFDGKPPVCAEVFSHENVIAFGSDDGAIRLFDCVTWKVEKKLTGGHNKPIVKMYSHYEDGHSFLVSASEDGMFCKWVFGADAAVTLDSRSETKGSLTITDFSIDPIELQLIASTDKGLIVRDARQNIELSRLVKSKQNFIAVSYLLHPRLPRNTVLALPKDSKTVCITTVTLEQEPIPILNINDFPKHAEAKTKVLSSFVHSLHSHRLFVVTTLGFAVVNFEKQYTPNVLVMPSKEGPSKLIYAQNGTVYSMSSASPVTVNNNLPPALQTTPTSTPMLYTAVVKLSLSTNVELSISPSSEFIAALFTEENKYQIISTKSWKVLEDGVAYGLAWSFRKDLDTYAILEPTNPPPNAVATTSAPNTSRGKSDKSKSVAGTSSTAIEYRKLTTRQVGSSQSRLILDHIESTIQSTPVIFGGPLLTLTSRCYVPIMTDTSTNSMRFFSWSGDKLHGTIPAPVLVAWDTTGRYCTVVYDEYFCVFRAEPTFKLMAKVADVVISTAWHNMCMFYSSLSGDIKVFFPHDYDCQDVILSSFVNDDYASDGNNLSFIGAISLLEIAGDQLVIIDSDFKLNTIRMKDPLVKFFALIHVGQIDDAMRWVPQIPSKEHPRLARFLETRGHAARVLGLKISLLEKLAILSKGTTFHQCAQVLDEIWESDLVESASVRDLVVSSGIRSAYQASKVGDIAAASRLYKATAKFDPTVLRHLVVTLAGLPSEDSALKELLAELMEQQLLIEAKVAAAVSDPQQLGSILKSGNFYAEAIEFFCDDSDLQEALMKDWNAALARDSETASLKMLGQQPQDLVAMLDRPPSPMPLM